MNESTPTSVTIEYLADHPHHAETIARWVFEEWGSLRPDLTLAKVTADFRDRAVKDRIPLALIAIQGDEVIGCMNLKESEELTLPGLSPWIGAVYVRPDRRGMGIGAELIRAAEAVARSLGVSMLYLSATDAEGFYERLGWKVHARCLSQGEEVAVMVRQLVTPLEP